MNRHSPPRGARPALYARVSSNQVDPAQSAIVMRIYVDYAAGMSPLAIAQALNNTARGGAS